MADVIRFGPVHVGQNPTARHAVAVAVAEADVRQFKTEGARRQFITRTLQAAGLSVSSQAMVRNKRYRPPHPAPRRWA